jgi:hypothetical protein
VAARVDRATVQAALRTAALVFVAAWLFIEELRAWVPIWLPLVVLLAAEVEFVLRGRHEAPGRVGGRALPGPEDADLGFGELVDDGDGVRFLPPPTRPARSRARRIGWLVGAATALAVAVALAARSDRASTWAAVPAAERAGLVGRITGEATRIARAPVRVRCDESYAFTGAGSDTLGVAFPRARLAYLDQTVCRALHDLVAGDAAGDERTAEALVVLAHEAVHLRGERREGVTECLALQEAGPLAVRLGLDEGRARALLAAELDRRLAERSAIRAAYALPSSCRNGGALDLRPGDTRFPY